MSLLLFKNVSQNSAKFFSCHLDQVPCNFCLPPQFSQSFQFIQWKFMSLFMLSHYIGFNNRTDFIDLCLLLIISSFVISVAVYISVFSPYLEYPPLFKLLLLIVSQPLFFKTRLISLHLMNIFKALNNSFLWFLWYHFFIKMEIRLLPEPDKTSEL